MPRVLSNISNNTAALGNVTRTSGKRAAATKIVDATVNKKLKPASAAVIESLKAKENVQKIVKCVSITAQLEQRVKNITLTSGTEKENLSEPVQAANSVIKKAHSELKQLSEEKPAPVPEKSRPVYDFDDPHSYYQPPANLPDGVEDFDLEQLNELVSEPHYSYEIFHYLKEKEPHCRLTKYMHAQPEINKAMRAVLVDWLVEVQESFELNHETLYLAVKLVDCYLMHEKISKSRFQLLGVTAMFIAAKFDERIPPGIADFLYICDDAYTARDIILFEIDMLKKIKFFLGFPLSYRFLRRYARCCKLSMDVLTLARYILEMSLMEYELIDESDSKIAAAAMLLAVRMTEAPDTKWSPTAQFYSGYCQEELIELMNKLNEIISTPKANLNTIRTKYSHKIFFEVAKISPLPLCPKPADSVPSEQQQPMKKD